MHVQNVTAICNGHLDLALACSTEKGRGCSVTCMDCTISHHCWQQIGTVQCLLKKQLAFLAVVKRLEVEVLLDTLACGRA